MSLHKHLPHINAYNNYQFITYRLADSLPSHIINSYIDEFTDTKDTESNIQLQKKIEEYSNNGFGASILTHPAVAKIIIDNWLFFAEKLYDLIAWVIMPNHVHLLIKEYENIEIDSIVKKWKSYTAKEILKIKSLLVYNIDNYRFKSTELVALFNSKRIWQKSYWDHYIRNEEELYDKIRYIHENPVLAGLVKKDIDWKYSSVNWK